MDGRVDRKQGKQLKGRNECSISHDTMWCKAGSVQTKAHDQTTSGVRDMLDSSQEACERKWCSVTELQDGISSLHGTLQGRSLQYTSSFLPLSVVAVATHKTTMVCWGLWALQSGNKKAGEINLG